MLSLFSRFPEVSGGGGGGGGEGEGLPLFFM